MHYAENPRAYIDSLLLLSLEKATQIISAARMQAHSRLRMVADPLLDFMRTPEAVVMRRKTVQYADSIPDVSTKDAAVQFDEWVSDLLFLGIVVPSEIGEVQSVMDALLEQRESQQIAALMCLAVAAASSG